MKRSVVYLGITLLIALIISGAASLANVQQPPAADTPTVETLTKYEKGEPTVDELLELVNAERAKSNVAPLTVDPRLSQTAAMKANDMATFNYFDHTNNDGREGYAYIFDTMPGVCIYASENIVAQLKSVSTSQNFVSAWKASEPHYKAMIDPRYTHTGLSVVYDADLARYVGVQHFCIAR